MLAKFFPHGPAEVLLSRMLGRALGLFKRRLLPGNASDADIRSLDRFGKSYDALWEKMRGNFSITVDKNSEYLNWRYFDCPTLREPVVHGLYEDGELAGVIVAAAYSTLDRRRRPCGRNGEILELIAAGASSSGIEALVLSASKLLDAKMVDKIGILCKEPYMQEALRGIGFCPQEDSNKTIVKTQLKCRI